MTRAKREKSSKYAGIYWRIVDRIDGLGQERMYYCRYRRGGRGTKEIEEPLGRASQGWTEAKANQERAQRISGIKPTNTERRESDKASELESLTVAGIWKLYLDAHVQNRSIRDDINRYNRHLAPNLADMEIAKLSTSDITMLRANLEKKKLSPQSVKHCLGILKRIIRYAKSQGYQMPDVFFDMPKVDNQKTENMTAMQLAAYWKALNEEIDQDQAAFFKVELLTGLRMGAVCGLKWEDIDFEHNIITLRRESAKNGKEAHIPMNAAAKQVLQAVGKTGSPYVFPGMDGGKRAVAPKMGRRLRKAAGLSPDFRPNHGLRHVFASHLASSGEVSMFVLQKLLTHQSPVMTARYSHLADEALSRAASIANNMAIDTEDDG